jgi:predicted dehydrogenase
LAGQTFWHPLPSPAANGNSINEQLRAAVIGNGFRGKYLIGNLPPAIRVTAISDCMESRMFHTLEPQGDFREVLNRFASADAMRCKMYQDYRELLDKHPLDAVIIATPDHHHVQAALLALERGLDVYLEKPMTLTIKEGRILADAVKATGKVLQVGSQQRTMEMNRFACEFIRGGGLGTISRVELPNYPGPLAQMELPAEPVPFGLNWNLLCGPAPLRPYNRKLWVKDEFKVGNLLWRGWDLFRDYSGHMMTNWGAHSVDMVQYALGMDDTGPVEIQAFPLNEPLEQVADNWGDKTPIPTALDERRFWPVRMKYASGVEVRFVGGKRPIRFYGERGVLKMSRNKFETEPAGLITGGPAPEVAEKWNGAGHVARPHLENWVECIGTRKMPNAPVEVGHRSVTVCHLANLARELHRPLKWDPVKETFVGDAEANRKLERPRREGFHLPVVTRAR